MAKKVKTVTNLKKDLFRHAQKPVKEFKQIVKMMNMFEAEMKREWTDDEKVIMYSEGNNKADFPSYSTMPGFSCMVNGKFPPCFLSGKCYAIYDMKYNEPLEKAVHNTVLILRWPDKFEESLEYMCKIFRYIRPHVDGDFVNRNELEIVDRVRKNNPSVTFMTYTKKYDMVNKYMEMNGTIDGNFTLLFSRWEGLEMRNPFHMPECHVYSTMEEYLSSVEAQRCGTAMVNPDGSYNFIKGQCSHCFINHLSGNGNGGCFDLKMSEAVAMLAH